MVGGAWLKRDGKLVTLDKEAVRREMEEKDREVLERRFRMSLTKVGEKHFSVVNHCVPRIDGVDKVTGRARYAADIYMEGMLYAGVLRSPYSSARVVSIDAAKAKAIPGVEAVVTCFDMPRTRSWAGYMYPDGYHPLLRRLCSHGRSPVKGAGG